MVKYKKRNMIEQKDVIEVATDPTWSKAAWISAAAFMGAFLRYQRWLDAGGKLIWWRILFDIPGSICFGVMAIGISYFALGEKVSPWIIGGMAGFFGMVGPAFIEAIATRLLGVKNA